MNEFMWDIEKSLVAEGYDTIAGVDEAGRGPLAGDVYAAAVILPFGAVIEGLDDSKKLTEKRREELFDEITATATAYGIASASVAEIAEHNILGATYIAMNRALELLPPCESEGFVALIDGNRKRGVQYAARCVVKGDSLSASIASASILAKVSRDREMRRLDAAYPAYGFAKHKGYGTAAHYAALRELGAVEVHRELFLRKFYEAEAQ